ncbi:MAG: hypothetical protein ABI658_05970 [Acidimicrobiales bacterium]
MITLVNSNGLRTFGYLVAAAAAIVAGVREHRSRTVDSAAWPAFWFVAGAILLTMAVARGSDIGGFLADAGRRSARSGGWYSRRRRFQENVVAALGAAMVIALAVAARWMPASRRRYLPEAFIVLALAVFAGVRLVSLHQVDALLYRRRVEGVKLDAVIELAGLGVAIVVPFSHRLWSRVLASAR